MFLMRDTYVNIKEKMKIIEKIKEYQKIVAKRNYSSYILLSAKNRFYNTKQLY